MVQIQQMVSKLSVVRLLFCRIRWPKAFKFAYLSYSCELVCHGNSPKKPGLTLRLWFVGLLTFKAIPVPYSLHGHLKAEHKAVMMACLLVR